MTKRAVLFDFGGVFMKTVNYSPRHAWDERLGLTHGSVERIVHGSDSWRATQSGQLSIDEYWEDIARQLNLDQNSLATLTSDYFSGDELDLELIKYVRHLRKQNHPIALLSNDSLALQDKLSNLGIDDLFDPIIISAQIGFMKPDPRAYQTALEGLKRPPEEVIFVDDLPANIEGARKLGIYGVLYTTTSTLIAALEPLLETEQSHVDSGRMC